MGQISRTYRFEDSLKLMGSHLESEISNIVNAWNNHNRGLIKFDNLKGTSTNDDSGIGMMGEHKLSSVTLGNSVSSTGSGKWFDVTSLSLTAGDWDVSGFVTLILNGSVVTLYIMGIDTASGDNFTGNEYFFCFLPTISYDSSGAVLTTRFSLASTTMIYLKADAQYSGGTPKAYGRISARRVR